MPTEARLELNVPVTADDSRWLVQIQLNGQLLDTAHTRRRGRQEVRVAIPPALEPCATSSSVTLVRDRDLGGCHVRQTTYQVQLHADLALVLGGDGAGFTAVPAEFADGFDVLLPSSSADEPSASLAGLVPTLAEFSSWQQDLSFAWDSTPLDRPFFAFGDPPAGVAAPVQVADGRITDQGFDLQAFRERRRGASRRVRGHRDACRGTR